MTLANGSYEQIETGAIAPSSTNPRKSYDEGEMLALEASIRESGIQVPLLVRPAFNAAGIAIPEMFELVCGSRRLLAATRLGLETVPCLVREDLDDDAAREIQIVENLQRADVHAVEEAEAYKAMIVAAGVDVSLQPEDIAKKVGKTTSYVAQRLALLNLEPVAKQLFLENYITLGHALLLARLTAEDQDRAAREMLLGSGDYATTPTPTVDVFAARKKNLATNQYARHSRLVEMTEGELKDWIASNVMLKLKAAPWDLGDAQLVPAAGSCTDCPKRSGSNAALFSDLTSDEDICLDAACYGVKHKAFVVLTTKRAEEAGEPLLKLTTKSGHKKLPEPVGEKTTFRDGQWMVAKKGSCSAVRRGIVLDDSSVYTQGDRYKAGDIVSVCVDQRCKVHKHTVENAVKGGNGSAPKQESWVERDAREKREADALRVTEVPVLRAVYDALLAKLTPKALYLQSLVLSEGQRSAMELCKEMGIAVEEAKKGGSNYDNACAALKEYLAKASIEQMHVAAFHIILLSETKPSDWELQQGTKQTRAKLWEAAKYMGVDANAVAKACLKQIGAAAEAKDAVGVKAAAKPVAKKVAKPVAKRKRAIPKKLSPEAKKRIAAAMKKRWAAAKKKAKA